MTACCMCDNTYTNLGLTSDNDFSSFSIGTYETDYRISLETGYSKPTTITVERHDASGWATIGYYRPRFCPNCGRELVENKKKEEGDP